MRVILIHFGKNRYGKSHCMKSYNGFDFTSDPEGIRTLDPQLRRLLLYPAELRNPAYFAPTKVVIK